MKYQSTDLGGPPLTSHLNLPLVARLTFCRMREEGEAWSWTEMPGSRKIV